MVRFKAEGLSPAGIVFLAAFAVVVNLALYLGLIAGVLLLVKAIFF